MLQIGNVTRNKVLVSSCIVCVPQAVGFVRKSKDSSNLSHCSVIVKGKQWAKGSCLPASLLRSLQSNSGIRLATLG